MDPISSSPSLSPEAKRLCREMLAKLEESLELRAQQSRGAGELGPQAPSRTLLERGAASGAEGGVHGVCL